MLIHHIKSENEMKMKKKVYYSVTCAI